MRIGEILGVVELSRRAIRSQPGMAPELVLAGLVWLDGGDSLKSGRSPRRCATHGRRWPQSTVHVYAVSALRP